MSVVGEKLPELELLVYTAGKIEQVHLNEYKTGTVVFIFYPMDFTFVCPTEISGFNVLREEFEKEGAKIVLVSCDSVYSHKVWAEMREGGIFGTALPMASDKNGKFASLLGIYMEREGRSRRATFIADNGKIVYEVVHDDPIGRSAIELMRVVRAINFHKKNGDICPLDWNGS